MHWVQGAKACTHKCGMSGVVGVEVWGVNTHVQTGVGRRQQSGDRVVNSASNSAKLNEPPAWYNIELVCS